MIRRPPRSTRTDTLFPYTTLFRSASNAITATANDSIGGYQGGVNFAYNIGDGSQIQLGGLYTQESLDAGTGNKHGYAGGLKYLTNGSKAGPVGIGIEGRKVRVSPVIGGPPTVGNEETLYLLGVTYQEIGSA